MLCDFCVNTDSCKRVITSGPHPAAVCAAPPPTYPSGRDKPRARFTTVDERLLLAVYSSSSAPSNHIVPMRRCDCPLLSCTTHASFPSPVPPRLCRSSRFVVAESTRERLKDYTHTPPISRDVCRYFRPIGGALALGLLCSRSSSFENNYAGELGGGINCYECTMVALNSSFEGNSANGDGGGMRLSSASTVTINLCTFTNNEGGEGLGLRG